VWLVELAALADPSLVPQTVASVLGVREQPGHAVAETLAEYLTSRRLLLMLDNCEHLLSASAQLAEALLRRCSRLCVLATSREALGIMGEQAYRVPSLSLPDARPTTNDQRPTPERLLEFEAVRLFVDRARLSQPAFAITAANAAALAQVCQRLDGIPLAIELAAARVKSLPVERVAERLEDRFRLLTGGSRTALPRQQTLRALIDWSYDLLSEPERTLLRRLSVFAGGWTLEAAEAICSAEGFGVQGAGYREADPTPDTLHPVPCTLYPNDVLDLLSQLVDKSLVQYEERDGAARYRLLETVRQYARERLLESGESGAMRDCHLEFFSQWAEGTSGQSERSLRFDHLEMEHDNLRMALAWSLSEEGGMEAGLRLATMLAGFWRARGHIGEAREWLTRGLAHSDNVPAALRARALRAAGTAADRQCDYGAARSLYEESLALFRDLGERPNIADTLRSLGFAVMCQMEYEQARALAEEALAIHRELRNPSGVALTLMLLGFVARGQGDSAAERAYYEEALALRRELGNRWGIAMSLHNLGNVARAGGQHGLARAHYRESLAVFRESGDKENIPKVLEGFACLASAEGKPVRSARLWGAADALHEATFIPMPPVDHVTNDPYIDAARTALGDEAFQAEWAEGRAMTPEQAIAFALEEEADG
jgi:non-specific serine/threonine protein kinase